jgi:hypothetical protein
MLGLFFHDVNWFESRASYFCCIKLKKRRASLTDLHLLHLTRDLYPKRGVISFKISVHIFFTLTAVLQTQPLQPVVK